MEWAMSLLKTVDRGAVRVITYANPPFGTMTATGSTEMFNATSPAGEAQSVRVAVITVVCRAYSSAITTLESSRTRRTRFTAEPRVTLHRRVPDRQVSTRLRI